MSSTLNNEILVVSVTATGQIQDIGAAASKAMSSMNRYRYSLPVRYTLEDGTKIESSIQGLTKPKLHERLARTTANIAIKAMRAQWYDYPDIGRKGWSFITSLSLR